MLNIWTIQEISLLVSNSKIYYGAHMSQQGAERIVLLDYIHRLVSQKFFFTW
jgi:hypothetical protein